MYILVAGHSFIRRLAFDARVRSLDFSSPDYEVEFIGKGGATIAGSKTVYAEIKAALTLKKPKLVILELGSNDLDLSRHPSVDVQLLAKTLVGKAKAMASQSKITVVLCLPIPRNEAQFPGSFKITDQFNQALKAEVEPYPNIHCWAHRGLFKRDDRFLDKHGVHLNSLGTIRYLHSMKAAIKYHTARSI